MRRKVPEQVLYVKSLQDVTQSLKPNSRFSVIAAKLLLKRKGHPDIINLIKFLMFSVMFFIKCAIKQ